MGTSGMEYGDRLKYLNLPSLEYRRFRGDLIEVYKIMHKFYDSEYVNSLFNVSEDGRTRGHNFKITKKHVNSKLTQCFFTNRVINEWNNLSREEVNSTSLSAFKNAIDRRFKNIMFTTSFDKS